MERKWRRIGKEQEKEHEELVEKRVRLLEERDERDDFFISCRSPCGRRTKRHAENETMETPKRHQRQPKRHDGDGPRLSSWWRLRVPRKLVVELCSESNAAIECVQHKRVDDDDIERVGRAEWSLDEDRLPGHPLS